MIPLQSVDAQHKQLAGNPKVEGVHYYRVIFAVSFEGHADSRARIQDIRRDWQSRLTLRAIYPQAAGCYATWTVVFP